MDHGKQTQLPKEKLEISLNKILQGLWTSVKHPLTGIIIGALIAIMFFIVTRKTKDPVFTISPPEMIAQTVYGEEEFKIFWGNKQVENVTSVKAGIWNNGSQFIDKSDITSTTPIRISPLQKVDILAVRVLKTSRPTLEFDSSIELDVDGIEGVVINIRGDDAFEKFDGVLFHVLFSDPEAQECTWEVGGRIKGVPRGFRQKDWEKVRHQRSPIIYPWSLVVAFLLIAATIIYTLYTTRRATKKGRKVEWLFVLFFDGYMLWFPIYIFILEYLYSLSPPWLVP